MKSKPFCSYTFSDYFWLAVILHLLLFCLFSTFVVYHRQEKKSPKLYVPAYLFKGTVSPPKLVAEQVTHTNIQKTQVAQPRLQVMPKAIPLAKARRSISQRVLPKSLIADSFALLEEQQLTRLQADIQKHEEDPIYLIGDESSTPDPLVKLIGRSLSAHFDYPRLAGELGIKGKVLIGLTLHPQGFFSDVQMLRSSGSQDLDNAALTAVNLAPPVDGADRFLSVPKHLVVGFIFKLR